MAQCTTTFVIYSIVRRPEQLFNLKFTSKSLVRASKKSAKAEQVQKAKVKNAIEKSDFDSARIYASVSTCDASVWTLTHHAGRI